MAEVVRWFKSGEINLTAEFSPLKTQSDAGTIDGMEGVNQGTESNVHVHNKGTLFDYFIFVVLMSGS